MLELTCAGESSKVAKEYCAGCTCLWSIRRARSYSSFHQYLPDIGQYSIYNTTNHPHLHLVSLTSHCFLVLGSVMSHPKRKHDRFPTDPPSHKKPRLENASPSYGQPSQDLPRLPPINSRFERPVFTHRSEGLQNPDDPTMVNYERLEFLGDAQLEHVASLVIFERYNSAAPGKMSTIRESLLRNHVLCDFSRMYSFDKKLRIGQGIEAITKENLVKIHADIFEAYVAAVILSDEDYHRGFHVVRNWLTALWEPMLAKLGMSISVTSNLKSKEELAKAVLVKGIRLNYVDEKPPVQYKSRGVTEYFIGVYLNGWGYENQHLGSGKGPSKTEAGQAAARNAMANPLMIEIRAKRTAFVIEKEKSEQAGEAAVKEGVE